MNKMEFSRGDAANHAFSMPASAWTPGATLFFAAKPVIDDDTSDANALIKGKWTDAAVTDIVRNGIAYKRYTCYFPPSATESILSGGAETADYKGEFQWVPLGGDPVTFPPTDEKIDVILYFDVKRNTVT